MLQYVISHCLSVDRGSGTTFKFNEETEFVPIIGLIENQLNTAAKGSDNYHASSIQENHHPALLSVLANELSVSPEEIHDFEVYVSVILVLRLWNS